MTRSPPLRRRQKKPQRRRRDVSPLPQCPPPRSRKVSNKQAETNKENLEHIKAQLLATQKKLTKEKRCNATSAGRGKDANDDDEGESEEHEEDDRCVTFSSSITAMGTIPIPSQRPPPALRKSKSAKVPPKISPRAFLQLPEPTAEECSLDSQHSSPDPAALTSTTLLATAAGLFTESGIFHYSCSCPHCSGEASAATDTILSTILGAASETSQTHGAGGEISRGICLL
ncbi:hypothetical protein C8R43DRAFT_1120722 [Mycena crocata]|nr:hypothetical protein C8R43DRAFT_1120722 [Mycena crocata]